MQSNQFLPPTAAKLVQQLQLLPHPEGGFFLETFRSGSVPMESKGQTNFEVDAKDLVVTSGRSHCRPDKDNRRNSLTSIYWVPTTKSPIQPLVCNESDHVHYYQGGLPMEYLQYDPVKHTVESVIIGGPDIRKGHLLQYPIAGGRWKCARLVTEYQSVIQADYSVIAEAVGPAFDFYDFHFVSAEEVDAQPEEMQQRLKPFLQASLEMKEIEEHYDSKDVQQSKAKERM